MFVKKITLSDGTCGIKSTKKKGLLVKGHGYVLKNQEGRDKDYVCGKYRVPPALLGDKALADILGI